MNKKIRELFEQVADNLDPEDCMVSEEFLEKFTELVVRECLNNMENCDGDLDFAIWKTKQDFGVGE